MILGIGVDMIHVDRIRKVMERRPRFLERILTEEEHRFLPKTGQRRAEWVAGRFAAKEAFAKALGTGIGRDLSWQDLSILPGEKGEPRVKLHFTRDKAEVWRRRVLHVSITHAREMAAAFLLIEEADPSRGIEH